MDFDKSRKRMDEISKERSTRMEIQRIKSNTQRGSQLRVNPQGKVLARGIMEEEDDEEEDNDSGDDREVEALVAKSMRKGSTVKEGLTNTELR